MGLFKEGFKEKGSGNSLGDGFYANFVTVNTATDVSGQEYQLPSGTSLFANDLAVVLTYSEEGKDREYQKCCSLWRSIKYYNRTFTDRAVVC